MASHPSGSEELVCVDTPSFTLTLKGSDFAEEYHLTEQSKQQAMVRLAARETAQLTLRGRQVDLPDMTRQHVCTCYTRPLLRDQRNYELIIEKKSVADVRFWHENYGLRRAVTPVGKQGNVLSGILNFRNEIGYTDLVVQVAGREYLRLTLEVFPGKIDYQQDYQVLLADLTDELYNLIFDFLQRTYAEYGQLGQQKNSLVEFFAIIRQIYQRLLAAVDVILHQPQHTLQRQEKVLPAGRHGAVTTRTRSWLVQHPQYVQRRQGKFIVEKALLQQRVLTYDTQENRCVRFMLEQTCRRLQSFARQYRALNREKDPAVMDEVQQMVQKLQQRLRHSFLAGVEAKAERLDMSLVFLMAPGYRKLYRYYLMLQRGLSVQNGLFHISIKDVAELYEYWCFIKLSRLLREKYELVSQDVIKVQQCGLFVSLIKGRSSRMKYLNPRTGEQIALAYNPKITGMPTVTQRPDNVLSLEKHGAGTKYEYVFDAKYRVNPATPGSWYAKTIASTPGPEVDDINTMHRYRDAIVYRSGASPYEQRMFGAYVLFPYGKEQEYAQHRFYRSIAEVNIGGVPFLPSATKLAETLLTELVDDSPNMAFERAVLPRGVEERLAHVDWEKRDVLVGALSSKEQLNVCLTEKFYHIPVRRLNKNALPIHTIALYQSQRQFGKAAGIRFYGEVIGCQQVVRSAIQALPKHSDELYYYFTIKEWHQLPAVIATKEQGVIAGLLTNDFLLHHSQEVPELRLHSETEYRLYDAMRRLSKQAVVAEDCQGIQLQDSLLVAESGHIELYRNGQLQGKWGRDLFSRHPWYILHEIRRAMHGDA